MHQISENTFRSFDTVELFYRAWLPQQAQASTSTTDRAIIIFHRGHEHSGRVAHLVDELNLPEYAFFAWDQRGHGRSPGERGYAAHLFDFVRDMESFVQHIHLTYNIPIENMVVIGHSVSAVLVSLWVKNYAPRIRGMVLATPAFDVKLYVPGALCGLRLLRRLSKLRGAKEPFIRSYVRGKVLTHDPELARSYDEDPLVSKQIASNILLELFSASKELVADAGAIVTPTLMLCARADWVVRNKPQRLFYQRLSTPLKRIKVFRGMYHALFHEKDREAVIAPVREFINEVFGSAVDRRQLSLGDRDGYTCEEYEWLKAGLPMLSMRRYCYRTQVFIMKTLGRLSAGISLGWKTGFDSGESLDHVYENQPRGVTFLGRALDSAYLRSVGWEGIRQRKINLEKLLKRAIKELDRPCTRIVDIAGGPARYVLDTVKTMEPAQYDVLIRDWSESGLDRGRSNAQKLGLASVNFERGDAFDTESVAAIEPKADVAIVSGLYELFPMNDKIQVSLLGLQRLVKPGGYLIYTNQPWHPQLELIAETLINRDHEPWIMRRRTQAEMDELVRQAGFEKLAMEIDNFGIFSVSLARRHV